MSKKQTTFMPQAWDDYLYWQTQDKKTLKRINDLISLSLRNTLSSRKFEKIK